MACARRAAGWLAALVLLAAPAAWGQSSDLKHPDPAYGPEEVVAIQLNALQANDAPEADAGIAQVWAFAHPDNRAQTGPLPRFKRMLKGPHYAFLLDHERHEIAVLERGAREALYNVTITAANGDVVRYQWRLARPEEGRYGDAWLTLSVSPPIPVGEEI